MYEVFSIAGVISAAGYWLAVSETVLVSSNVRGNPWLPRTCVGEV